MGASSRGGGGSAGSSKPLFGALRRHVHGQGVKPSTEAPNPAATASVPLAVKAARHLANPPTSPSTGSNFESDLRRRRKAGKPDDNALGNFN